MSVAWAPRARMAVKAAWPGVSMNVIRLSCHTHLVRPDVLGDAAGLAGHHVGRADAVEQEGLAVVDVSHHGHHGRTGPLVGVLLLVLLLEVAGQQLGFLLLARVDQADLGPDLGGEELDHVVGQRLRRHDHLALEHQEADDVTRTAVQLGPEVAGRRAALDDDLAVGHGCGRGLVAGELRRLELFEVAPAAAGAPLGRAPSRAARCGRPRAGHRPGHPHRVGRRNRRSTAGFRSCCCPGPPGPPVGRPAPGAGRPPVRAG